MESYRPTNAAAAPNTRNVPTCSDLPGGPQPRVEELKKLSRKRNPCMRRRVTSGQTV
jgi:hypothetical protein